MNNLNIIPETLDPNWRSMDYSDLCLYLEELQKHKEGLTKC